jgi:predicted RNase H-like HicB family nuclease
MKYTVILEPTPTGFSAYIPDLPGCVAAGATRNETLTLLREGLELHLDAMRRDGEVIPSPASIADVVEIAA